MATFLNGLLADARWYLCSILLSAALLVDWYLLSHPSGLGILGAVLLSFAMAGSMFLLLRSRKTPKDPSGQSGELNSLRFRAAVGKKSK